ncbi:homoserine kinase [Truepera radiovictrix]|uniref:homoserine kinase n=1 Tax=Truepera radiovictrix TaxID=332249 RepID=UPI001C870FB2|nr:homoserine kinase [Truepera radiovictrix]WMT55970.1 homoserine kinase [Truepera radiovictrix]
MNVGGDVGGGEAEGARVRVPATSANLGPGFDCLGLAVGLYLEVRAQLAPCDAFFYRGPGSVPSRPDNLTHEGFRAAYAALGRPAPRVRFEAHNEIPLARGLGSSSAALVAGVALADHFSGGALGREGVFEVAAALEGHPDNVAPAVYGGFTVSAKRDGDGYLTQVLALPARWRLLFAVPDFELLTSAARAVLPSRYGRDDAVFTASRCALWTTAVALDRPELLGVASQDRLHEPFREPLIPGLAACRRALLGAGASAAFLSGAGPTLGVIYVERPGDDGLGERLKGLLRAFAGAGEVLALPPSAGYVIEAGGS